MHRNSVYYFHVYRTYFPCEARQLKIKLRTQKHCIFPLPLNHVRQLLIKTEALLLFVRKYEITSRPLVGKNRCVCAYPFTTLQPNYYTIIQCCVLGRIKKSVGSRSYANITGKNHNLLNGTDYPQPLTPFRSDI